MRVLQTSVRPSSRLLRACAGFGVGVRRRPRARLQADGVASHLLEVCGPGNIVLLSGPSGSGKSRLLMRARRAASTLDVHMINAGPPCARSGTILDCLPGTLDEAIGALASAGLADVGVLARTPRELSEGERWRFGLACAMLRARQHPRAVIVCDEWCSTLDRPAARGVCITAQRWIRRERIAGLLCATAHEDVVRWLGADLVVDCSVAT